MSITTLNVATSGLLAARAGLNVTGHNIANIDTPGFSRQRVQQSSFAYANRGLSAGGNVLQVGLGTNINSIRNIRDRFLDMQFRATIPSFAYNNIRLNAGLELEAIFGELEGEYRFQMALRQLHQVLSELANEPNSLDTRRNFISVAGDFLETSQIISNSIRNYQIELNNQVHAQVHRINQLVTDINDYNRRIMREEIDGSRANDFRDSRANAIDELASIVPIRVFYDGNGRVDIFTGNAPLTINGRANTVGVRQIAPGSPFVEPVFTNSLDILEFDPTGQNANPLFNWQLLSANYSTLNGGGQGSLLGILVSRGMDLSNFASYPPLNHAQLRDEVHNLFDPPQPAFAADFINWLANPSTTRPTLPAGLDPTLDQILTQISHQYFTVYQNSFNMQQGVLTRAYSQLDTLVNHIVTKINDALVPQVPGPDGMPVDLHGNSGIPLFVRMDTDFASVNGQRNFEAQNRFIPGSLYTITNIQINPALLGQGGESRLPLHFDGESDGRVILDILTQWGRANVAMGDRIPLSIDNFYRNMIDSISVQTEQARSFMDNLTTELLTIDNWRLAISGVSLEEEMANMIRFQHAYSASARVISIVDSMLETLIRM